MEMQEMLEVIIEKSFQLNWSKLNEYSDVKREGADCLVQVGTYEVHTESGNQLLFMYKTDKEAKLFGPREVFCGYNFPMEGFHNLPYQERTVVTDHPLVLAAEHVHDSALEGDILSQFVTVGKCTTIIRAMQWLITNCVPACDQSKVFQEMSTFVSFTLQNNGVAGLISPSVWTDMVFKLLAEVAVRVLSDKIQLLATVVWPWVVRWFRSLRPLQKAIVAAGILVGGVLLWLGVGAAAATAAAAVGCAASSVATYASSSSNKQA
eukprot:CAMPEP_0113902710 /NCGR_PEP_ID=MMETSP0780_2-20120614/22012_1 /TAXON_ID=652834 /ORGANISM="Palpitomonas bilix" /LENGTH=263 /DNA_ID=CAMNT_0000895567 /DNA_START=53 /DNA_END=845 /DNA_ORIENTATION=- /assembly_acc=CAM_ASM_000599